MSALSDFNTGDRVAHVRHGDGVVELTEFDAIYVKYDRGGEPVRYDAAWFRRYPLYLFHRSEPKRVGVKAMPGWLNRKKPGARGPSAKKKPKGKK